MLRTRSVRVQARRLRRVSTLAAALFVGAVPLSLPVAGPATAAPASPPALSGPEAAAASQLASDWDVSWAEAVRRIARQKDEQDMAADIASRYPSSYAGAFVDQANGGRFVLLSTSPIDVSAQARAHGLDPSSVSVSQARFSLSRLNKDDAALTRLAQQHSSSLGRTEIYLDVPSNRVQVRLPQHSPNSNARSDFISSASEHEDVTITSGPTSFTSAAGCDFWTCPPPLRGGVEDDFYDAKNDGYLCSIGFIGVDKYNNDPVAISAGHCQTYNGPYVSPGPDDLFYAGLTIGNMTRYQNGGNDDGEVIDLTTGGGTYAPDSTNYVYQRNQPSYIDVNGQIEDDKFQITSVASNSQVVTGVYVCKSGRTSGFTCGDINETAVSGTACESGTNNCTSYTNFFGFAGCAAGGDSGAPIYDPSAHRAFGLISYVPSSQYSGCTGTSGETYGPMIGNVTYGLHVSINTIDGSSLV